jgi:DNA adenine methylase
MRRSHTSPITQNGSKKIVFGYYGGKYSHLDWLLPLLPKCHHYCEPFAGSAAVLINRDPSPVETYNDLDGEITTFFKVLRDDSDRLIREIGLTPFSRQEFAVACEIAPNLSNLERARRFYVRARQVRTGLAQTASVGRWANCKNTSRAGMGGAVSRWLGAIRDLPEIAERLLRVQIENRPAIELIRLYDSPTTLFYCDPPYIHSTRGDNSAYGFEMTDDEHRELALVLNSVDGMVAISNYDCVLMSELYPQPRWHKIFGEERTIHSTKDTRTEVLWTNYDPNDLFRNNQNFWLMEGVVTTPAQILETLLTRAMSDLGNPLIKEREVQNRIEFVVRQLANRACTRLLMSCTLAKLDRPNVDVRKPYTEINTEDSFSGRTYDERYITHFINTNRLPVNNTTAYLTPAFRNIDQPLTNIIEIIGRPRDLYRATLQVLDDVQTGKVLAGDVLTEIIRILLIMRDEKQARMQTLLAGLQNSSDTIPLSTEDIITIIEQHLKAKHSSRLPVLVVAAAYRSVSMKLGEKILPLNSHNAADSQTGSYGDVEVRLENDDKIVTVYEMKAKRVTVDDIDTALEKIARAKCKLHNYIFITTDIIDVAVLEYSRSAYDKTCGTEIAILDCIGFTRHFLHLFHRSRTTFLDEYQQLVLNEPDSAVSQPLKELFLALRQAAETDE